jgi:hypothetical protein
LYLYVIDYQLFTQILKIIFKKLYRKVCNYEKLPYICTVNNDKETFKLNTMSQQTNTGLDTTKTYYRYADNGLSLFEVLKETAKTVTIVDVTTHRNNSNKPHRVKKDVFSRIYAPYVFEPLTTENMKTASTVVCLQNPEWGTKRFTYDAVHGHHSRGSGCNSALLFENEFKFYSVVTHHEK